MAKQPRTPKPRGSADGILAAIVTNDWFRKVAPKTIPAFHQAMNRLTRGRFVPGAALVLHTTGAKTGQPRTTPLEATSGPDGTWVLVGSNFAREFHPAWTSNLIANPECEIVVRGRRRAMTAELLEGPARDIGWQQALDHFGAWDAYTDITNREFRIFRLSPR